MQALFERYRKMVFAVGLSITGNATDADEVVQESFLRAFRRLGEWRGESKFSTWLYTIATRVALDWQKRFHRKPKTRTPEATEPGPHEDEIERLMDAINRLPLKQRMTLTLRHYRAMTLGEIAEAMDVSVGTVKANLHFALTKLRDVLAPDLRS